MDLPDFVKKAALFMVSKRVSVPENPINRYHELLMLKKLIDDLNINCIFDVGANRGQFADELRQIGYKKDIISFEPVPSEFDALYDKFKNDPCWLGKKIALGDENKTATINVDPNLTVMSSILIPIENASDYVQTVSIEVRRLDDLYSELVSGIENPRVFLKLDTQGYDLNVFRGAEKCRSNILGLQSEVSVQPLYEGMPSYLEALREYESDGFELYNLEAVSRTHTGGLQEMNSFMRRRNERL